MSRFLGIGALILIALILFGYFGSELPQTNPLQGLAGGIRGIVEGIVDSIAGVGRGVAGVFGG